MFSKLIKSIFSVTSPVKEGSKPERPPNSTKASLMGNKQHKESFGSKDSLNENNSSVPIARSATGPVFGNVAAHRKSLEQKKDASSVHDKPPRKSLDVRGSLSDMRKSQENLDDKKGTPPPVMSKKPNVPIKKSPSVTSVTNNIFTSLKQKVKGVESKLTPQDAADGAAGSKPGAQVADNSDKGVIGERIKTDTEFDVVERNVMLQDPRASRAKAPNRRPPSSIEKLLPDTAGNQLNGNNSEHAPESPRHDSDSAEIELVKPKPREWEKHKAPWMAELKASQAKKTSPGHIVESKTPEPAECEDKVTTFDMAKSFSSSFVGRDTSKPATNTTTLEVRSHSVDTKPTPVAVVNDTVMAKSTPIVGTRISINEKENQNHIEKVEPTSLRNRSISPIGRRPLNLPTSPLQRQTTPNHSSLFESDRINDLEDRVGKLEKQVSSQNTTIDDLRKQLADEAAKVKILRMQLEKYAQCVTQV